MKHLRHCFCCEKGATAIEYGLIAAGVGLVLVVVVFAFGDELINLFDTIGGMIENAQA